jgi:hypothetical protein
VVQVLVDINTRSGIHEAMSRRCKVVDAVNYVVFDSL